MCHYRFTDCNKCTTVVQDVNSRGDCVCVCCVCVCMCVCVYVCMGWGGEYRNSLNFLLNFAVNLDVL